jgi:hypothetical protein
MTNEPHIQYLQHNSIDKEKWDKCIANAPNGLVYAYSFYLDCMAKQWDALVLSKGPLPENDYEAVMPLTFNKKLGIHYLYQPFIAAQLGAFGNNVDKEIITAFLDAVPAKFKYWDIYLNYGNVFNQEKYNLYQRNNFILHLNQPYENLYANYRDNIKRNIKKCFDAGCFVKKEFEAEEVIKLAVQQMRDYNSESKDNTSRFRKLYDVLKGKEMATTYGIALSTGELMASCILFLSHNRIYYILVGNHPNGRTIGASHALIDGIIKDFAGRNMLLDFEGSDISSLAFFYSSFGAAEEKYAGLKVNRLPFYLRWLKK